jgi:hypothetical protein
VVHGWKKCRVVFPSHLVNTRTESKKKLSKLYIARHSGLTQRRVQVPLGRLVYFYPLLDQGANHYAISHLSRQRKEQ